MPIQSRMMLDSPAAVDGFCAEHYQFVYSKALELTDSPTEAHTLTRQVFETATQRFATKPIAMDCDRFLAAQVHVAYAMLAQKNAPMTPISDEPIDLPATPWQPMARASHISQQMPNIPLWRPMASLRHRRTENALVIGKSRQSAGPATAVVTADSMRTGNPAGFDGSLPETAAYARPAVSSAAPVVNPPLPNANRPASATVGVESLTADQMPTAMPWPGTAEAIPSPTVAEAEPSINAVTPVVEAVYNADDTEFWVPFGESSVKPAPVAEADVPWEDEVDEKPSLLLSVLNVILMLGSVASLGFLLFELNTVLNLF